MMMMMVSITFLSFWFSLSIDWFIPAIQSIRFDFVFIWKKHAFFTSHTHLLLDEIFQIPKFFPKNLFESRFRNSFNRIDSFYFECNFKDKHKPFYSFHLCFLFIYLFSFFFLVFSIKIFLIIQITLRWRLWYRNKEFVLLIKAIIFLHNFFRNQAQNTPIKDW